MNTASLETITLVLSAVGTDATAGLDKFEWHATEAFSLQSIAAQCDADNPPTGSTFILDVNKGGTTLLSTKVTIDAGEWNSDTAATPPVLTTTPTAVAKGDILDFDIDQIGSTNAGQEYKAVLYILRPKAGP